MRPITPGTVLLAQYGTVIQPGTVTATGIDFAPNYEPDYSYVASCGAISAGGTLVAHLQQSAALASGYVSVGSVTFNDAGGGTTCQTVDIDATLATARYVRSLMTVVGGTVTGGASAVIVAKARTVTS